MSAPCPVEFASGAVAGCERRPWGGGRQWSVEEKGRGRDTETRRQGESQLAAFSLSPCHPFTLSPCHQLPLRARAGRSLGYCRDGAHGTDGWRDTEDAQAEDNACGAGG